MGPSRTHKFKPAGETSEASSSKAVKARKHAKVNEQISSVPGVQKIKASLRQTRRLLAKVNYSIDYLHAPADAVFH